jgi:hypothetical protein
VELMRAIINTAGKQGLRLLGVTAVALALGACSKCDVMPWQRNSTAAPQSCHDGPPAQ